MKAGFSLLVSGFFIIVISTVSCSDSNEVDCSGTTITFMEANAIIQSSCARNSNCHGVGSNTGPGSLTTYAQIYNSRNQISTAIKNGSMPKDTNLSSTEKNTILCWIENGAVSN